MVQLFRVAKGYSSKWLNRTYLLCKYFHYYTLLEAVHKKLSIIKSREGKELLQHKIWTLFFYYSKKNSIAIFHIFTIVAISKNSKSPNQLILLKKTHLLEWVHLSFDCKKIPVISICHHRNKKLPFQVGKGRKRERGFLGL